jgi:hypothetical protein
MIELLDVMNAIPQPLKAGWAVWVVCGAGLVLWHHRASPALPAPRPRPRRAPKPATATAKPTVPEPTADAVPAPVSAMEPLPLKIHSARVPGADQQSATA